MFSRTLGGGWFTQPLARVYFKPFRCTQTYHLAPGRLGLIIVYGGVLCFHLSLLIRHREGSRCCSGVSAPRTASLPPTQPLCPVTLDWDPEKESWKANVTAWVICLNLDSEHGAYPLSSFTTARRESDSIFEVCPLPAFRLYSSPFPLAPYLDKLVRKPNKPSTTSGRFKLCAP